MTDWTLIRAVMTAAIDACEAADRLALRPEDRARATGSGATVWDVLTSAWTYPENVQYAVIRARHAVGDDAPYRPELSRPLIAVAGVCAELVGATHLDVERVASAGQEVPSIRRQVNGLAAWYRDHMVPQLQRAAEMRVAGTEGSDAPAP